MGAKKIWGKFLAENQRDVKNEEKIEVEKVCRNGKGYAKMEG